MSSCEYGNEPLGSIKCKESHEYLKHYQLPKKDSAYMELAGQWVSQSVSQSVSSHNYMTCVKV